MTKVAVYGSLRQGFHNHGLLGASKFLGSCKAGPGFKMLHLGAFPGVVEDEEANEIFIEVYEVEDGVFRTLDALEGYPSFYDRQLIPTKYGKAWMYFLHNGDRYNDSAYRVVESGDWARQ